MGGGIAGPRPVGSQKGPGGGEEAAESPPEKSWRSCRHGSRSVYGQGLSPAARTACGIILPARPGPSNVHGSNRWKKTGGCEWQQLVKLHVQEVVVCSTAMRGEGGHVSG